MEARRIEPSKESGDSAWRRVADPVGIFGRQFFVDELAERLEAAYVPYSAGILESNRRGLVRIPLAFAGQNGLDACNQVGHLTALIASLREHEAQQRLPNDIAHRPEVGANALLPTAGVGDRVAAATANRRPNTNRLKRARCDTKLGIAGSILVAEPPVGMIQEQEVLALDVE